MMSRVTCLVALALVFLGCSKKSGPDDRILQFYHACMEQMELDNKAPSLEDVKKHLDVKINDFIDANLLTYNSGAMNGRDVLAIFKSDRDKVVKLHLDGSVSSGSAPK